MNQTDQPAPRAAQPGRPRRSRDRVAGRAAEQVATVLAVRMAVSALLAVLAVVGAVLLYRHSMRSALWGPFQGTSEPVEIVRYSMPWLMAAAGMLLVAGLLLTAFVADLVRHRRVRRAGRTHT